MISLRALREQNLLPLQDAQTFGKAWASRPGLLAGTCGFMLVCSLVLGGGTRGGFLSDTILELLAIPALLISLWSLIDTKSAGIMGRAFWPLVICFAVVFLPLLQLVPLPPWIWTELPGRGEVKKAFDLVGVLPWMPISVSSDATWIGLFSLLAPLAIFLATIQLNSRERRGLSLVIIAMGIVGVFVGLMQLAQGPNSSLRFFAFTNANDLVGFFANKNHFAAFLYVALLFAAAWAIDAAYKVESFGDLLRSQRRITVNLTFSFLVVVILITGESMTRSRSGLILTIVALVGIFAMMIADQRRSSRSLPNKLMFGATIFSVMFAVQFALYRMLDRFAADPLQDARIAFGRNTFIAAKSFLPLGSGMGTFAPIYSFFERPEDTIPYIYANHAHDDFLELLLESGLVGMGIVAAFFIWFGLRSVGIWRESSPGARNLDLSLARAATLAVMLLALHSFMDYPLRTEANMAIFAFACALLVKPLGQADEENEMAPAIVGARRVKKGSRKSLPKEASEASGVSRGKRIANTEAKKPAVPPPPVTTWGDEIEWPEEWRKPTTKTSPNDT